MRKKFRILLALVLLAISLQKLGSLCNHVVVTANNDTMPVLVMGHFIPQLDDIHSVLNKDSKYWALSDIFFVPLFYWGQTGFEMISIGDIAMDVGTYLFLFLPLLVLKWIVRR